MKAKGGAVYILTNKNKTTLYVGVTSNLLQRVYDHKNGVYAKSFTKKYNLHMLVYFNFFETIEEAIAE
jgi:putative endonuclease